MCNLRRLGVPPSNLDDATQDVFLVVHRRLPEYVAQGSTKAWMFAITLRVARDYRRRHARKGGLAPLEEQTVPHGGLNPMESATRSEGVEILERLLHELDDEKREAFVLVEVEEMTVAEAAAVLGANASTVQSRVRAARMQFEAAVARHQRRQR